MSEVTAQGFTRTRLDERFDQLVVAMQAIFGPTINLDPDSVDGQTLGIYAESISNLDQLAEDVYNGFSPQGASGLALSRLVQINGIRRIAGAYSTAVVRCVGIEGTTIPAGSLIGSTSATLSFTTIADATIGASGQVDVNARAVEYGATLAPAGTLNKIDTPIYGWQTVTNTADAVPGRAEETDEQLRIRRAQSTATPAQSVVDGIYGALANLSSVSRCRVFENVLDTTDANGLPPHSIYCVVDGGAVADIANQIWLRKSAGSTMYGALTQTVTDSQGGAHSIKFSRPGDVNVYITINLVTRSGWPTDGAQRIKDALVAWGLDEQEIGEELIYSRLFSPVNTVPGFSITSMFIGTSASPTGTANITVPFDSLARVDSARIVVNVSP